MAKTNPSLDFSSPPLNKSHEYTLFFIGNSKIGNWADFGQKTRQLLGNLGRPPFPES